MVEQFIFILGRTPELSVAEILAVLKRFNIFFKTIQSTREILIVESDSALDVFLLNKTLGGTVKIGKIVRLEKSVALEDLPDILDFNFLKSNFFENTERKVDFDLSMYSAGPFVDRNDEIFLDDLSWHIKNVLSENGIPSHFPKREKRFLSSASVAKNKLLTHGAEILILKSDSGLFLGRTLCVQEFEEFSKRDYARPHRDLKSGTMPPKLARIMINLASESQDFVILDPFCGSGTVIQEAILLGYKKILGRDLSQKAIDDSKKNTEWLKTRYGHLEFDSLLLDLKTADVKNLSNSLEKGTVDAIITEPYLGPTLHTFLPQEKTQDVRKELEKLYIASFCEFARVLKRGGFVVMVFPVFNARKFVYLDIIEKIKKIGFFQVNLSSSTRHSILVGDKRDFVLREIVKFTLN